MDFFRLLASQFGAILYQAKLYEREKNTFEREKILRKIIEIIRNTLDINQIKKVFVTKIGQFYGVDRVFFIPYDSETESFLAIDEYSEYLPTVGIKSFVGFKPDSSDWMHFIDLLKKLKEINFSTFNDYIKENNLKNTGTERIFMHCGVKSGFNFLINYGEEILGFLCVDFITKKYEIKDEDYEFLRILKDQFGIALYQSNLYNAVKQTLERERVLREIIEVVRSTLDINKIKKTIVTELGKLLKNSTRTFIIDYDKHNQYFLTPEENSEYLAPNITKSVRQEGENFADLQYWTVKLIDKKEIIQFDSDKLIQENELEDKPEGIFLRKYNVQSALVFPIIYFEELIGAYIIHSDKKNAFRPEEITLARAIASQSATALYQAKLYENSEQERKREVTIRKIIDILRSSIEYKELKRLITIELGKVFDTDRCYFLVFDKTRNQYITPQHEYLKSKKINSLSSIYINPIIKEYFDKYKSKDGEITIENVDKFIKKEKLEGTELEEYLTKAKVKSDYSFEIFETEVESVRLIMHFCTKTTSLSDEDKNMLRTILRQCEIGLQQAYCYDLVKLKRKEDAILREIIIKLRSFKSFNEVYDYFLMELVNFFSLDRAVFIKKANDEKQKMFIKYEYKKEGKKPFNLSDIDNTLIDAFNESSKTSKPVFLDTKLIVPFEKKDINPILFGFVILETSSFKHWLKKEFEFLERTINVLANEIWDRIQLNEIEELRNTFILTLAHDLQVPTLSVQRVLEFINSKNENEPIKNIKPILEEFKSNNDLINNLLNKLIKIYKYELKTENLNFEKQSIEEVIREVVLLLENKAQDKSIAINLSIEKNIPFINIDKTKIKKVIYNILENAIDYNKDNGQIAIKCYPADGKIEICIADSGYGIKPEIQKILFKRYATSKSFSRKIGSGLSLYLSKQIIEAHKGKVLYETEEGKGTTFYITLPIKVVN